TKPSARPRLSWRSCCRARLVMPAILAASRAAGKPCFVTTTKAAERRKPRPGTGASATSPARPPARAAAGRASGGGAHLDAAGLQQLLQLAGLEHLADDVAAADELALNVELGDRRPAREVLDALAQAGILE